MKHRILHLSTVHPVDDVRIFHKEVRSLRGAGYEVIVTGIQTGPLPSDIQPARIIDKPASRFARVQKSVSQAVAICRELRPDVLHFHDPELLLALPLVARFCGSIIYDSHEFISEAVEHKSYLPPFVRSAVGTQVRLVERVFCNFVDAVVAPTPHIAAYYRAMGKTVVEAANYPARTSLPQFTGLEGRAQRAIYTGGLSSFRGLAQMLEASRRTGIGLDLAGPRDGEAEVLFKAMPANVCDHGLLPLSQAATLQTKGMVGMSLLMPTKQYVNAIPTKVFEFFAAGLIVICSDFPFLRGLFDGFETITYVDPQDNEQIARALQDAIAAYGKSEKALLASRDRVLRQFTWEAEADRLIELYATILGR